jgi:hypothetical protein
LESLKGGNHSEDVGIDGRIILIMDLTETVLKVVDWIHLNMIHLAQDTDLLQAPVNTII